MMLIKEVSLVRVENLPVVPSNIPDTEALADIETLLVVASMIKSPDVVSNVLPSSLRLSTVSWPRPVIFCELPVIAPPKVKALMVRVPVELEMVSVLMAEDSRIPETEARSKVREKAPTVMVVLASTFKALANSSKSKLFDVTSLLPTGKIGTLLKVQVPVTVSSCDSEAGPPEPQSRRTYPLDAVLEKVKWDESN